MPPFTSWYLGNENIGRLIATQCPGGINDMPMIETRANGQPAFGLYMRTPHGDFEPFHLQVLDIVDGKVAHVGAFFDPQLFATFGLPARLPVGYRPGDPVPDDAQVALGDHGRSVTSRSRLLRRAGRERGARRRRRAARAFPRLHTGHARRRPSRPPRPADAVRRLDTRSPAGPHGGRARRVHRGGLRAGRGSTRSRTTTTRVEALREKACVLLGAWTAARPADDEIAIGDLGLDAPLLVATAALEITVHGWDVGQATGSRTRIPDDLARGLLGLAQQRHRAARPRPPVRLPSAGTGRRVVRRAAARVDRPCRASLD